MRSVPSVWDRLRSRRPMTCQAIPGNLTAARVNSGGEEMDTVLEEHRNRLKTPAEDHRE